MTIEVLSRPCPKCLGVGEVRVRGEVRGPDLVTAPCQVCTGDGVVLNHHLATLAIGVDVVVIGSSEHYGKVGRVVDVVRDDEPGIFIIVVRLCLGYNKLGVARWTGAYDVNLFWPPEVVALACAIPDCIPAPGTRGE